MASEKISAMPMATTSTAPDLYPMVQSAVNTAITFAHLQSAILATAAASPYTPADSSKWVMPLPTTLQQAIDRIAAVVGSSVPIP